MKLYVILLSIFAGTISGRAQCELKIEITNLRSNEGMILLELFDENHKSIGNRRGEIKDNACNIRIEGLTPAKYAVSYYHDENANGKVDTNFMGIPTEGYGFSNDAYGNFGPLVFDKWLVDVQTNKKILLKTTY